MLKAHCPRCHLALHARRAQGLAHYYCAKCQGLAVDFQNIRNVMPADEVKQLWDQGLGSPVGPTPCCQCRKPMRQIFHQEGARTAEVDFCTGCQIVWLDTGEWQDVNERRSMMQAMTQFEPATQVATWKMTMALVGLPVEYESDRFQSRPWLTWAAIAICVLASALAFRNMDYALEHFAHLSGQPFPVGLFTSVSAFFIHSSWAHLIFNMYFFWVFGDNVEEFLGKWRYFLLLVFATLAGDTFSGWMDPRLMHTPGVGASGGIAGLIAYYLMCFPYRRFVMMIFFRPVAVPAVYFGLFYYVVEIVGAFNQMGGVSSVSHLSHLGGAIVGIMFALAERDLLTARRRKMNSPRT